MIEGRIVLSGWVCRVSVGLRWLGGEVWEEKVVNQGLRSIQII